MKCRHCNSSLSLTLVDLGSAPPSNSYLTAVALKKPEKWFPLRVLVCEQCWLVQTEDFANAEELFDSEYAYFSGFSTTWLEHCQTFVRAAIDRFQLNASSHVVEVAANDGYLLQYVQQAQIPCTGIEPTASTARAARQKGIEIVEQFFGTLLAEQLRDEHKTADLMIANNVLAHVPDINDFVAGFARLLKPQGVAVFEFPHLKRLIDEIQFDTIYHEHYSYLSLSAVKTIFERAGLRVFDVEQLPTHGGSLRVFAQRADTGTHAQSDKVQQLLAEEYAVGVNTVAYYSGFQNKSETIKNDFLEFLLEARRSGRKVAAYGAAAKGNTLMNFAGIRPDLVEYVVDRNPAKYGKFMPGSRIPIRDTSVLTDHKPDVVVILPWNLADEIAQQLAYIRNWGGQLVRFIPKREVV